MIYDEEPEEGCDYGYEHLGNADQLVVEFWSYKYYTVYRAGKYVWQQTTSTGEIKGTVHPDFYRMKISLVAKSGSRRYNRYNQNDRDALIGQQKPTETKRTGSMNNSLLAVVADENVRLIIVNFAGSTKPYTHKTTNKDIAVDDFVVVPVNSCATYGNIAKVVAVDVTVDMNSSIEYRWIVQRVDYTHYNEIIEKEKQIIEQVHKVDMTRKRQTLLQVMGLSEDDIKQIPKF